MTTHTNKNGINYYSKTDENGEIIYSFTIDFDDTWTQEEQNLHGE